MEGDKATFSLSILSLRYLEVLQLTMRSTRLDFGDNMRGERHTLCDEHENYT